MSTSISNTEGLNSCCMRRCIHIQFELTQVIKVAYPTNGLGMRVRLDQSGSYVQLSSKELQFHHYFHASAILAANVASTVV